MRWPWWPRPAPPPTPSEAFASSAQWRASANVGAVPSGAFDALCGTCGTMRRFPASTDAREGLACPRCGLNGRQRAAVGLLRDRVPPGDARVYATEQASPLYVWLKKRWPQAVGSEFGLAPERAAQLKWWLARHGVREDVRQMDVTALPFADASLDAVLTLDVLEHVPDYRRALAEFARVLSPGGTLVLTAPFATASEPTIVRARRRDDGTIEHLLPEEIHGDPVSGGVLCFYHFGWDLPAALRDAGFARAAWHRTQAPEQALFGMWTLLATR
jgi:SAM-dependent methyltransferase